MKKSIELVLKKSVTLIIIVGVSAMTFSCGDDEKFDCDASEDKLQDLVRSYYDADCDDREEPAQKIIAELKKAKNCDFVKDAIDDANLDNLDELIAFFEIDDQDICLCQEEQFDTLEDEFIDAYDAENCNEIADIYLELISVLKEASTCDFAEEMANDEGFISVDDFTQYLEDNFDQMLIDLGC